MPCTCAPLRKNEARYRCASLVMGHLPMTSLGQTKSGLQPIDPKDQRQEVKKRFRDSKVQLMGLGSTFDYHTPDQAKLRQDTPRKS